MSCTLYVAGFITRLYPRDVSGIALYMKPLTGKFLLGQTFREWFSCVSVLLYTVL